VKAAGEFGHLAPSAHPPSGETVDQCHAGLASRQGVNTANYGAEHEQSNRQSVGLLTPEPRTDALHWPFELGDDVSRV
jgi:hypothetical protein